MSQKIDTVLHMNAKYLRMYSQFIFTIHDYFHTFHKTVLRNTLFYIILVDNNSMSQPLANNKLVFLIRNEIIVVFVKTDFTFLTLMFYTFIKIIKYFIYSIFTLNIGHHYNILFQCTKFCFSLKESLRIILFVNICSIRRLKFNSPKGRDAYMFINHIISQ